MVVKLFHDKTVRHIIRFFQNLVVTEPIQDENYTDSGMILIALVVERYS